MRSLQHVWSMVPLLVVAACSTPSVFPPQMTKDLAPVDFGALQATPDVFKGRAVQLAGRIISTQESPRGTLIVVQKLPLREHGIYGPIEQPVPGARFAVLYPGKVDPAGLWYGNKLTVVAIMQGTQQLTVDGGPRIEPYFLARCMHIWKTGGYGAYDISDFPHTTDGYWPLEQETYCATEGLPS